jgi:Fe2+ transport system protein FeoA
MAGSFLAAPIAAQAAQAGSWRVGFLETSSASPARVQLLETLRQRLRELGYVEGQNITFESRFGEGKPDQIQRSALGRRQRSSVQIRPPQPRNSFISAISLYPATIRIDSLLLPGTGAARAMTNVLTELRCGGNARSFPTILGITSGLPTIRSGCKIERRALFQNAP